jgi:hypothetical protein
MKNYHPDWTRVSWSGKYRTVFCPAHPQAWPNGYIYVHRLVMEWKLGKLLQTNELVHHANEVKDDNSPHNLELKNDHAEHLACHRKLRPQRCLECKTPFRPRRSGVRYCSRRCGGKANRRRQIKAGIAMGTKGGWKHGTLVGYGYHGCRCPLCKAAKAKAYQRSKLGV